MIMASMHASESAPQIIARRVAYDVIIRMFGTGRVVARFGGLAAVVADIGGLPVRHQGYSYLSCPTICAITVHMHVPRQGPCCYVDLRIRITTFKILVGMAQC